MWIRRRAGSSTGSRSAHSDSTSTTIRSDFEPASASLRALVELHPLRRHDDLHVRRVVEVAQFDRA